MRGEEDKRVFAHDGSSVGLLCAACEYLNARREGEGDLRLEVAPRSRPEALFEERVPVTSEGARAEGLLARLESSAGTEAVETLLAASCSDLSGADAAIARMAERLLREGAGALDDLANTDARLVERAAIRTRREAHRMTGLLRFRELRDGSLFATIDPDCDVLGLIAEHFAKRFPGLRWAIRDERRDAALVHEPGRGWSLGSRLAIEAPGEGLPLAEGEEEVVAAWLRYFATVAITERANPRLQAAFMPRKYWKNLPERQGHGN